MRQLPSFLLENVVRLSILDHSPLDDGCTASDALWATTRLAQTAESLGYERYWVAEHHQSSVQVGSNPELLMMQIAAHTETIRVGSGGIMLPHYSAYKVAETARVLEALYPGRIDLGIGRAPGADQRVTRALNDEKTHQLPFPVKLNQLKALLLDDANGADDQHPPIYAAPRINTLPEFHILGASGSTAELVAAEGMGFTFAHFINPHFNQGVVAAEHYRANFRPSRFHAAPSVIVAVFAVVADTVEQAERLAISFDDWLLRAESAIPAEALVLPEAVDPAHYSAEARERIAVNRTRVVVGDGPTALKQLQRIADQYQTDQMMVIPMIPGEANRQRAIELLARANQAFNLPAPQRVLQES
jgi:luciferase family oxidoreductase group 1